MGLITAGGGLTNLRLRRTTAQTSDVISGKTFYAGDKNLKTGTLEERSAYTDVTDIVSVEQSAYIRIPMGAYRTPTSVGKPEIRVPLDNVKNALPGGNRGSWGTTINPGASVAIPQGYHDGNGRVYANNVQSQLKVASFNLSLSSSGVAYGETKDTWWNPGGTVIGITNVNYRGDTESGESEIENTYCEVRDGQIHFVTKFTHRGGNAQVSGTVVFI